MLKELKRQRAKPKLIIGLTSSSSQEVMKGCPAEAEGMIIPTSFAPITDEAKRVAELANRNGGDADLHSAAAWENVMIIKKVIEEAGITGDLADEEALDEGTQHVLLRRRDGVDVLVKVEGGGAHLAGLLHGEVGGQ